MIRRVMLMLCLLSSLLLVVACGVSGESDFEPINSDNLPDQLIATTTTTTTTTTTVQSTSTTVDTSDFTTTLPETTTTSLAIQMVDVYYVVGRTVVSAQVPFQPNPQVAQVLFSLEQAPTSELTTGFRTAVPAGRMSFVSAVRGLVTIELEPDFFDDLEDRSDPTIAIAQIVMTVTRLSGISLVTFTMNGEPATVLLADSSPSEPGQQLNYDDYSSLLNNAPPPVTTTTTTTPTAPETDTVTSDTAPA